jgi:hypothetical protein
MDLNDLRKELVRCYMTMAQHYPGSSPYQRAFNQANTLLFEIEQAKRAHVRTFSRGVHIQLSGNPG